MIGCGSDGGGGGSTGGTTGGATGGETGGTTGGETGGTTGGTTGGETGGTTGGETGGTTGGETTTCEPACDGKQCGPDGCEGDCGTCGENETCTEAGMCEPDCAPQCEGKQCGDDTCGGDCGTCEMGTTCDADGMCVPEATGECGTCAPGTVCGANPDAPTWCIGEDCGGVTFEGECLNEGSIVVFCDADVLNSIDCAGLSEGANACGFVDAQGYFDCIEKPPEPDCEGKVCGPDGAGGSCGECGMDEACNADGQCEACDWLCDGKDCGDNGCGGVCGECEAGALCDNDGMCVDPATLPNNVCATATAVLAETDTDGSTVLATADYSYGDDECGEDVGSAKGAGSNDHVYMFTPDADAVYTVTVNADFDSGTYAATTCDDVATSCVAGSESAFGDDPESFTLSATAGTTYYIFVDGWSNENNVAGDYTLSISAPCFPSCTDKVCGSDGCGGNCGTCEEGNLCETDGTCAEAATVTGNTCGNPFVIGELPYSYMGSTDNATNDIAAPEGACEGLDDAGGGSNDQVYSYTPAADGIYSVEIDGNYDAAIYLATTCDDIATTCLLGADAAGTGEQVYANLTADTMVYIVVDGWSDSENISGDYTLNVSLCTPSCEGKTCGSDGCGGDCGECGEDEACNANGACVGQTCDGFCGLQNPAGCWCDDGCFGFGDCCADICEFCEEGNEEPCSCVPDCEGKDCGADGCFSTCGECEEGMACSEAQICEACGENACGGTCGECEEGFDCADGQCVASTCAGSCGSAQPTETGCYCDSQCFGFGDCCGDICTECAADFKDQCDEGDPPPDP